MQNFILICHTQNLYSIIHTDYLHYYSHVAKNGNYCAAMNRSVLG